MALLLGLLYLGGAGSFYAYLLATARFESGDVA